MKKNQFFKFVAGISVVCGLLTTSCEVIEQPYYMGYDADDVFTTPNGIRPAALGMYDAMQNAEFLGGRAQIYADIRSMNTNPSSYFGAVSTFDGSLSSSNTIVLDAYQGAYRTLFEINLFLEKLAANPGVLPADEEKQYTAEGKFLRAVVYFYTLQLWGQQYTTKATGGTELGVPLVLRSYDGVNGFLDEAKVPRSSVADIYAQIEKDLTEALPDLLDEHLTSGLADQNKTMCRATTGAAQAMLSRVYLYREKYNDAITAADAVAGYTLDDNLKSNVFAATPASDEIIFFVAHNANDNPNTNNALGQHYGVRYRGDITVSSNYVALFSEEPNDTRKGLLTQNAGGAYFCNKYPTGSRNWAPIIRYAEVLLNKAEAQARTATGVSSDAITILNQIRSRSGITTAKSAGDFADKDALLDFILDERRRELAFEGLGFDAFRFGKGIAAGRASAAASAVPYPSDLLALPIPEKDISKAPGIVVQNPGY